MMGGGVGGGGREWSDVLGCAVCAAGFGAAEPVSLPCTHTLCRHCLSKLRTSTCPFDQTAFTRPQHQLLPNLALLSIIGSDEKDDLVSLVESQPLDFLNSSEDRAACRDCLRDLNILASYFEPLKSEKGPGGVYSSALSRPVQRKLVVLLSSQLGEGEGRVRAVKAARGVGERALSELLLLHQNSAHLSSNLWSAVRGRGCQFLGPAMQEEVLRLILLTLSEGAMISRKTLVMYIVQTLEKDYPQASKTSVGHVVQLLYRASCFNVMKRDGESSLMQLKEEFRHYDTLRREHDSQIVQIAMESGLRISPDQWSSLLYGDQSHRSHMQSIMDKLSSPAGFSQSIQELILALQRTGDPPNGNTLTPMIPHFELLASIDLSSSDPPSWQFLASAIRACRLAVGGQVDFCANHVGSRSGGIRVGGGPRSLFRGGPRNQWNTNPRGFASPRGGMGMGNRAFPPPAMRFPRPPPQLPPGRVMSPGIPPPGLTRPPPPWPPQYYDYPSTPDADTNLRPPIVQPPPAQLQPKPLNSQPFMYQPVAPPARPLTGQMGQGLGQGPGQVAMPPIRDPVGYPQAQRYVLLQQNGASQGPTGLDSLSTMSPIGMMPTMVAQTVMSYQPILLQPQSVLGPPPQLPSQAPTPIHVPVQTPILPNAPFPHPQHPIDPPEDRKLRQLSNKRQEIVRRLTELEDDEDKVDHEAAFLSYSVASSVLNDYALEDRQNFSAPRSANDWATLATSLSSIWLTEETTNTVTTDVRRGDVRKTEEEEPVYASLRVARAHQPKIAMAPTTVVAVPTSQMHTKDTLTQPVASPHVQTSHPAIVNYPSDPQVMCQSTLAVQAACLPPSIKGPVVEVGQSGDVGSRIDRIVEVREAIGELAPSGATTAMASMTSAVEKEHLRWELHIVNKQLQATLKDKQTERDNLLTELESVDMNIARLQ